MVHDDADATIDRFNKTHQYRRTFDDQLTSDRAGPLFAGTSRVVGLLQLGSLEETDGLIAGCGAAAREF